MEPNPDAEPAPADFRYHPPAGSVGGNKTPPGDEESDDRRGPADVRHESRWRIVGEVAARQRGLATTGQLASLGLSRQQISVAAETGRLHPCTEASTWSATRRWHPWPASRPRCWPAAMGPS